MALLTVKEFASMCGVTAQYVKVYHGRGKVVIGENGYVDTENELNRLFFSKRKGDETPTPTVNPPAPAYIPPAINTQSNQDQGGFMTYADIEKQKAKLQLEKIANEVSLSKLKVDKLNGELIPTEMVRIVFQQHTRSIATAFKNGAENFLAEISKRKALTPTEEADIRKRLLEILNQATDDSLRESLKQVKNIVLEYSETRGRGEKK